MRRNTVFLLLGVLLLGVTSCASRKSTVLRPGKETSSSRSTTASRGATSISGLSYIDRYKDIAVAEMNRYGIPASIKLAQALLESGSGNSYLAKKANNHFGIKCGGTWNGKSVNRPDDRANDCFRVYTSPEQSFEDHSQFLLRKRYEKLFRLDKDDYKGWARGLKDAGYATNPRYPQLLIDLIERYELYKYDRLESSYVAKEVREEKVEEIIHIKEVDEPQEEPEEIKSAVAMIIHEVKSSDTLFGIAKEYGVSVEQIKTLNSLSSENLSLGQMLVITK